MGERRASFDDIRSIDRDRCIVTFTDGGTEQCSPLSQRYAKLQIASAHPDIKDVHFERMHGQRFQATLFVSVLACIEEVIMRAKASEPYWLQNCVDIVYRTTTW